MKRIKKILYIVLIMIIFITIVIILDILNILPKRVYKASDFDIETIYSGIDYNKNGIDDLQDILIGARKDAKAHPKYVANSYTAGGYPEDDIGVCSDVIWRAFKEAGYSLKDLVDKDISENIELYPATNGKPDKNIDFRRVRNLKVFFDRYATILTNDIYDISSFQPGDIVIFGEKYTHVGIISDKRNKEGIPYLIHNAGQPIREEDALEMWTKLNKITGHYRWNKN